MNFQLSIFPFFVEVEPQSNEVSGSTSTIGLRDEFSIINKFPKA